MNTPPVLSTSRFDCALEAKRRKANQLLELVDAKKRMAWEITDRPRASSLTCYGVGYLYFSEGYWSQCASR